MNGRQILIALLCGSILVGCARHGTPKIPMAISRSPMTEYAISEFQIDYGKYKTLAEGSELEEAQILRDRMINRIEVEIERSYREFEAKLFYGRGVGNVAADIVELGLSASIGSVDGVAVKDLLATSLTSFKGTRLSIDKNFFREKTTEIIISKMQADRDRVRNRITEKMSRLSIREYPFEEAWRDLVEHFFTGTLQGGVQGLANDAGHDAEEAKQETDRLEELRIATPEWLANAQRIRGKFNELFNAANQSADQEKANAALNEARSALKFLTGEDTSSRTGDEVFKQLNAEIRRARREPDQYQKLLDAFKLSTQ